MIVQVTRQGKRPTFVYSLIISFMYALVNGKYSFLKQFPYPAYLKSYAPQINLPYPKNENSIIYEFYEILETDEDSRC